MKHNKVNVYCIIFMESTWGRGKISFHFNRFKCSSGSFSRDFLCSYDMKLAYYMSESWTKNLNYSR